MRRAFANRSHKYGAKLTTVDGIRFSSKAEAKRYQELKLLEKAGEIHGLVLQPRYPLWAVNPEGRRAIVGHYVADFAYLDKRDQQVIEDVKGVRTAIYRWKRKHFEFQDDAKITEVR